MLNPTTHCVLTTPLLNKLYHLNHFFSTKSGNLPLDKFVHLSKNVTVFKKE